MPAEGQTIEHWAGDTRTVTIPIRDKQGVPINLTGATARWWMGKNVKAKGTNVLIKKDTADASMTIVVDTGQTPNLYSLRFVLQPADTEALKAGTFYHEAEVVDASGNIGTTTTGDFILHPTMIPDIL